MLANTMRSCIAKSLPCHVGQSPLRRRLRAHIAFMPQRQCGVGVVLRQQPRLLARRPLGMRFDP